MWHEVHLSELARLHLNSFLVPAQEGRGSFKKNPRPHFKDKAYISLQSTRQPVFLISNEPKKGLIRAVVPAVLEPVLVTCTSTRASHSDTISLNERFVEFSAQLPS